MAGPSLQWLSTGFPSLQELGGMPAPAAGPPAVINLGAPPQAPPPMLPGAPAPAPAATPPETFGPPRPHPGVDAPPPEPPTAGPPNQPTGPGPWAGDLVPHTPPPKAESPPMPADVQFRGVGGGVIPAHEAPTRGPTQNALLLGSFQEPLHATDQMQLRSAIQAQHEADVYEIEADKALKREEAAQQVAMKRQAELDRTAQDYEAQIQQLGRMHLDDNRWWANKTTGEKIGSLALVILGSVSSLGPGGQNLAYEAMKKEIDNDLDTQKFDYMTQMRRAEGAKNAFGMAMERYQSEDAAMAAARAGALDFAAMKAAQLSAQWKGTDSANAADELRAKLLAERDRTAAAGLQFIPAKGVGGGYKMLIRGQEVPGIVSEAKAQEYAVKYGVEPGQRADEKWLEGGIQLGVETGKAHAQAQAKSREHAVQLPNGETVYAPSDKEAETLRELSTSASEVGRMVREAKTIRDDATFRVSIEGRNKLAQIQKELVTHFGVQHKLGALSDKDYETALAGTADLFQFGNGVEARLDRYNQGAVHKVTDRVKTYPGAPPKSSGQMPGSFTSHGGK
jgi:hypothetical protein